MPDANAALLAACPSFDRDRVLKHPLMRRKAMLQVCPARLATSSPLHSQNLYCSPGKP